MKRLLLALAFAGLFSPAYSAGTIPLSMSQQLNTLGKPLSGCKLYIIQAGTTSTPQNAYQDSGLTIAHPNPLTCDSSGRLPQFFLADGQIKVRLADANGVNQTLPGGGPSGLDNILVIGPSGGGGGGGTIDPTTILTTGDLKVTYGTGVITGFVRANGRTIGSSTSGASERANADTQALFLYLWGADTNLAVSTGRGASAAADWAANKTIALPDWRGRALAGLDDMGNTAAGRLTAAGFGAAGTTLGLAGGAETLTLTLSQLPTGITSANASQSINVNSTSNGGGQFVLHSAWQGMDTFPGGTGSKFAPYTVSSSSFVTAGNLTGTNAISVTSNNTSGLAHRTLQPTMLATFYIKL
jgi:microcystin-dependent protein